MPSSNVIQGNFPRGVPQFRPAAVQPYRQPMPWVQQAIAQGRGNAPPVQRQPAQRLPPPPPVVQRLANGNAVPLPPDVAQFPRQGGQPLPSDVRQKMEAAFATSFADVRIHVGPHAPAIGAVAFTHGPNVYFAPGHYNPQTPAGQRTLAHELAHVVQQRAGRVRNPYGTGLAVVQDDALEAEALRMAERAARSRPVQPKIGIGIAGPVIQRALAYDEGNKQDDLCGGFKRTIAWKLTGTDLGPGVILQHVTKVLTVYKVGSTTAMTIDEIKTYVKDNDGGPNDIADHLDYWEAWEVPKGATAPKDGDLFGVPCIFKNKRASKDTTYGSIVMKGEASWHPGVDINKLGMKQDQKHASGGLHYSDSKPVITAATSTVTRTYTATWDSTVPSSTKGEYGKTTVKLT